jgi:hypothetical protein
MKMPKLDWDETDTIECLEVLPEYSESGTVVHFEVSRNGLTLRISVFPYESTMLLDLYRCGAERPLIGFALLVLGRVEFRKEKCGEYLWIHNAVPASRRFSSYAEWEDILDSPYRFYGLDATLVVNPDIKVELGW